MSAGGLRRFDEVDRNETTDLLAMSLLYDEVRDRALDRIDDYTHELPTWALFTVDPRSDRVFRCFVLIPKAGTRSGPA